MIECDHCGLRVETEAEALTWTLSVERGDECRYCAECSRTHLRAIEAKLDADWW